MNKVCMLFGFNIIFKGVLRVLPVVSLIVLFSCAFEPEGEFFTDVSPSNGNNLVINLNAMSDTDTAFVFSTTAFSFTNSASPGVGRKTTVLIDGKIIEVINGSSGTFSINPETYSDGVHSLAIEFVGSSSSGSLADTYGKEDALIKKQWILFIDKSMPEPVPIISVEVVDGMLEVTWMRYSKTNFQEYVLEKYIDNGGVYSLCGQDIIPDKDLVMLRDDSNMRGNIRYALKVRAGTKESVSSFKSINVEYDPQLTVQQIAPSQVRLTWRKPQLYASFKHYSIMATGHAVNEYREILNVDDTTVEFTLFKHFGLRNAVSFSVLPLGENQCAPYITDTLSITNGGPFTSFYGNSIVYNKSLDAYYAIKKDKQWLNHFVRINAETGQVERTYFVKDHGVFAISENGEYLYVAYNSVLKQLDPVSFEVMRTYNLTELTSFPRPSGTIKVANNGILSIVLSGRTYVLDNSFQALKMSFDASGMISVNGEYYAERGQII